MNRNCPNAAPEEPPQQFAGARRVDAAIDLRAVMAGRLGEEARAVLDRAALGIAGAEIEPAQARERDRGGAHGAGLERDIEIAILEPRRAARGAAARIASISAWAVGSASSSTRLPAAASTAPVAPSTSTAPTGTSPRGARPRFGLRRARAPWASARDATKSSPAPCRAGARLIRVPAQHGTTRHRPHPRSRAARRLFQDPSLVRAARELLQRRSSRRAGCRSCCRTSPSGGGLSRADRTGWSSPAAPSMSTPRCSAPRRRHASVTTKDRRTAFELAITRGALARDRPVLGICGGQQLLNVALGGTLIQHIPDEVPSALAHEQPNPRTEPGHVVRIAPGTLLHRITGADELAVNSAHHQAVKDAGARHRRRRGRARRRHRGHRGPAPPLLPRRAVASRIRHLRRRPAHLRRLHRRLPPPEPWPRASASPSCIARAGLCSRRDAERWIAEGRVALGGKVLTSPAVNVERRRRHPRRRQAAAGAGARAAVALSQAAPGCVDHASRRAAAAPTVFAQSARRTCRGSFRSGGSISIPRGCCCSPMTAGWRASWSCRRAAGSGATRCASTARPIRRALARARTRHHHRRRRLWPDPRRARAPARQQRLAHREPRRGQEPRGAARARRISICR